MYPSGEQQSYHDVIPQSSPSWVMLIPGKIISGRRGRSGTGSYLGADWKAEGKEGRKDRKDGRMKGGLWIIRKRLKVHPVIIL